MNSNKSKPIILILLLVLLLIYFISDGSSKSGTPAEVLDINLGSGYETISEILDVIEVNDEGDALCVFETVEKIAVAYLNCVGNDTYKFGIAVEYDPFWEMPEHYDINCLKAGDSDLLIKYVVTYDNVDVKDSTEKYSYAIGEKNVALHILSLEEENSFGYVYYLEAHQSKPPVKPVVCTAPIRGYYWLYP